MKASLISPFSQVDANQTLVSSTTFCEWSSREVMQAEASVCVIAMGVVLLAEVFAIYSTFHLR